MENVLENSDFALTIAAIDRGNPMPGQFQSMENQGYYVIAVGLPMLWAVLLSTPRMRASAKESKLIKPDALSE